MVIKVFRLWGNFERSKISLLRRLAPLSQIGMVYADTLKNVQPPTASAQLLSFRGLQRWQKSRDAKLDPVIA